MYNYWWVFLGGGIGSICRYGIARIIQPFQIQFPWATWTANVISCIILGMLLGLSAKGSLENPTYRLLFMTGFCGGFSTFSTFTAESFYLIKAENGSLALVYIGSSLLICLVCIFLGSKVVEIF